MAHFLFLYRHRYPDDPWATVVDRLIVSTLDYLSCEHRDGLWHQADQQSTIRFYPTLYLLAYPVYLHYRGKGCTVIADYPDLVRRLSADGFIHLTDGTKVYRTTLRYTTNLFFNSFLSESASKTYVDYRRLVLQELCDHYAELNSHEIFGAYVMVDNMGEDYPAIAESLSPYFERDRIFATSLARRLSGTALGNETADEYQNVTKQIFDFLFLDVLSGAKKEQSIHHRRKRADIVYANSSSVGFFDHLHTKAGIICPYIILECKNYNGRLNNSDFDQICGRFSNGRGNFGIIVCRRKLDDQWVLEQCRNAYHDGRGYIIVLDDEDVRHLLEAKVRGNGAVDDYLGGMIRTLLF